MCPDGFFPSLLRTKEVLLRKPKPQLHFESWMAIEKVVVSDPLKASAGPYREVYGAYGAP